MRPATTTDSRKLISEVHVMVEGVIKCAIPRLMGVDLVPSVRPPRTAPDAYELCIEFLNSKGIADVIEFHVVRDGQAVAALSEIRKWLDESVADVVQRADAKISATRPPI